MASQRLRVGILGAGQVAQVVHLPTLALLDELYETVAIADVSRQAVEHCARKFKIPKAYTDAYQLIGDDDVDVVFILTSDEFHAEYAIAALLRDKHVMVEKPVTLSIQSAEAIIRAEASSAGRVFVGYMRRYAASFTKTFLKEVASIPVIKHAFVRDIVGPNIHFVDQSGTDPKVFTDCPPSAGFERQKRLDALLGEAFPNQEVTKEKIQYARFLGSLGSHDLSLMREAIGFPDSVAGVALNEPFYSAIFNYTHQASGKKFSVSYETGIDDVPRFDAQLTVFGETKTVSIIYQSPYVKALPIEVKVTEKDESGGVSNRTILTSYEDAYTIELKEMHAALVGGHEIKTTVADALNDLKLFDMMYRKAFPTENWP
ncbi:hypothetical protein EDC01DRAFT_777860 [Geopyxis carbonaria]|nr:hypothetical protein EDC01DRAFT_777860 [Geopyxis carbonaria]